MKPSTISNCQSDDDVHFLSITYTANELESSQSSTEYINNSDSEPYDEEYDMDMITIQNPIKPSINIITLQDCSEMYLTGYLVKKTVDKFNCEKCIEHLNTKGMEINDPRQLLIINKTYETNNSISKLYKP